MYLVNEEFIDLIDHPAFGNTFYMLILSKTQQGVSHLHFKIFQISYFGKIFSSFVHNQLFVLYLFSVDS